MDARAYLVVTSIAPPTEAVRLLARGCERTRARFVVIGDRDSPASFVADGCDFYDLARQRATGFRFAALCPERTYARKNVGYLLAARAGAELVVETDDDNLPTEDFWSAHERDRIAPVIEAAGWVNVYRYFSEANAWPRGFPLSEVQTAPPPRDRLDARLVRCPIQQSLVDGDPDVDAILRLTSPERITFRRDACVALGAGSWCPVNSQNTAWWREAFPLLYLPATCSLRVADIWRGFVAQRIAHANGWSVLFQRSTVRHARNEHDLMADFEQEIPAYLHNAAIKDSLERLPIEGGVERLGDALRRCYETLVAMRLLERSELGLLDAWLSDLGSLRAA